MASPQYPGPVVPPNVAPPRPSSNAGVAKGCALGCGGLVLLFALVCGGFSLMMWRSIRAGVSVAQAQATALGRGDAAGACAYNSPQLAATMTCEAYISTLMARAPYFAGAEISAQGMNVNTQGASGQMRLPITARGARGTGAFVFNLVKVDGDWKVQSVDFGGYAAPPAVPAPPAGASGKSF